MADDEPEQENMWTMMLKDVREKNTHSKGESSTLYVLGDPQCGKTSVLNSWKDRVASKTDIPEYVLDYSYVNVKDRFDLQTEEVISRLGIWQLSDIAQADLLPKVACNVNNCAFVIGLDLAKPHSVLTSLEKWLKVYKDTCAVLMKQYSDDHAATLKTKLSTYTQTFEDEETKGRRLEAEQSAKAAKESGNVEEEPEEEHSILNTKTKKQKKIEVKAAEPEEWKLDPKLPKFNTGIPLLIVGMKAESFEKTGEDEKFMFVVRKLRQKALLYGATIIYTSAIGAGINTDVLKDHVFHRLFGLILPHKPQTTGSCTQWPIHIPAGFDKSADITDSKIPDNKSLEDIFEYVAKTKEETKHDVVSARSDQEFFNSLRGKLGNGRRAEAGRGETHSKKKKEKAVKSFFKSLLSEKQ